MQALRAGRPGELAMPMLSLAALREARSFSLRDLSVAPAALRLSEAAPQRVVLASDEAQRTNLMRPQDRGVGPSRSSRLTHDAAVACEVKLDAPPHHAPAGEGEHPRDQADQIAHRQQA